MPNDVQDPVEMEVMARADAPEDTDLMLLDTEDRGEPDKAITVRSLKNALAALIAANATLLSKTADYTVLAADNGKILDNTGATIGITFTLPAVASSKGYYFRAAVKAAVPIVIDGNASEAIYFNGVSATTITLPPVVGLYADFYCDGTQWLVVSRTHALSKDEACVLVQPDATVAAKTADATLTSADYDKILTNTGATEEIVLTLEAAADCEGKSLRIQKTVAKRIRITPASGEGIYLEGVGTADASIDLSGGIGQYIEIYSDGTNHLITQYGNGLSAQADEKIDASSARQSEAGTDTLVAADFGINLDNVGATGATVLTLPAAATVKGQYLTAYIGAAQQLSLSPASDEAVYLFGDGVVNKDLVIAGVIGNYVRLYSDGSNYRVIDYSGVVTKEG